MAAAQKTAASAAKKTAKQTVKKSATKAPAKKAPAKKAPAKKAPAKKAAAKAAPAKKTAKPPMKKVAAKSKPKRKPVVREDESPWTAAELRSVRQQLDAEVIRLEEEIATAEAGLQDLIRDSGDGAGDDQADAGSKTFEREHEMSLANNARDMLLQAHHALARIDNGTYGICESCGKPIGKYRLQAFPRATLCLVCKQQEERS
jgi:RNA polymerase-binding protein DksA